jgi:cyanate permease
MMHLVASISLPLLAMVSAFGTINEPLLVRQHNEHEIITRLAFQCPSARGSDGICFEPRSLDQLAGWHVNVLGIAVTGAGFNGAVGAPDTLDPVPEGPEAHCDDADYLDVPGYPRM